MTYSRTLRIDHTQEWLDDTWYLLKVKISRKELVEWCLSIAMLRTEVVDVLVLLGDDGQPYMKVRADAHIKPKDRGVSQLRDKVLEVTVGPYELLHWLRYYLLYYRDGLVGAGHIDVDLPLTGSARGQRTNIVLMAADVGPPMTPEEAQALLDED